MLKKRRHRITRTRVAQIAFATLLVSAALGYGVVRLDMTQDPLHRRLNEADRLYASEGYAAGERALLAHLQNRPDDVEAWHLLIERRGQSRYVPPLLNAAAPGAPLDDALDGARAALSAPVMGASAAGLNNAAFDAVLAACPVMPWSVARAWLVLFTTQDLGRGLHALIGEGPPDPNDLADAGEMALVMNQNDTALRYLMRAEVTFPRDPAIESGIIEALSRLRQRDALAKRLSDPRVRALASEPALTDYYLSQRDFFGLVVHLTRSDYAKFAADVLFAVLWCGLGWLFFLAVMGGVEDWTWMKRGFLVVALGLGVVSAILTLAAAVIQDDVFRSPGPGAHWGAHFLYFVFGVGFREEFIKLLLFVPMAPLLQKAARIEALTLAAAVGLGFAAQENAAYFFVDTGAVMGRFLTANFFHMSMTGLIGLALVDALNKGGEAWMEFTQTFFLIVVLHGAYDFLLTGFTEVGPYLAMTIWVLVAQRFLQACVSAQTTYRSRFATTTAFTVGLFMAIGATFALAEFHFGVRTAFMLIFTTLIANVFIAYVFYREFVDEIEM